MKHYENKIYTRCHGNAFGMTGCNLDITMYDGVMEEQIRQ